MHLFLYVLAVFISVAHAERDPARFHCVGKNQDNRLAVVFDFVEHGFIEGSDYGSKVISITRIGRRAIKPEYRFQRVGASEDNACEFDSFGDRYLWKFTQLENRGSDATRFPFTISFQIECADMPLLNVSAKCERE